MKELKSFCKEYEDSFDDYLEDVKNVLRRKNKKYIKLRKKFREILEENENLSWILEGQIENRILTNKECFSLAKLVQLSYEMQTLEEKEIFFSGGKNAYFLFKRIGILR